MISKLNNLKIYIFFFKEFLLKIFFFFYFGIKNSRKPVRKILRRPLILQAIFQGKERNSDGGDFSFIGDKVRLRKKDKPKLFEEFIMELEFLGFGVIILVLVRKQRNKVTKFQKRRIISKWPFRK